MKQKLAILAVVVAIAALGCWTALAFYNPHITDLDLSIDGVADGQEFYESGSGGPGGVVALDGWKKITLKATGVSPMKTRLNWNSTKIEVWTATSGGTQITSPKLWDPASGMPTVLWVKGVAVSATGPTATSCGPEHMTLEAINNGEDPATPGTYYDRIAFTVYKVETVSATKPEIAAGALASPEHQTKVTVHVTPALSAPVAVWLVDGDGFRTGPPATYNSYSLIIEGPATIQGGGSSFICGGTTPSTAAILVTTDASGNAALTLTSSNEIDEQCKVHAKAGTDTALTGSQASCTVTFRKGDQTITLPDYLPQNTVVTAKLKRSLGGTPLPGHDTVFYVSAVKVSGKTKTFDYAAPSALDIYARVVPGDNRKVTDAAGEATAGIEIKGVSGLEEVTVSSRELQIFRK